MIHMLTREAMNNIVHFLEKVSRDHNHKLDQEQSNPTPT